MSMQEKFNQACDNMSLALKNLEEAIISKLDEKNSSFQVAQNYDEESAENLKAQLSQQQAIVNNLNEELNNLQINMKEIGKENDFLKDKNRFFADKIFKFKSQGAKIIQSVEDDLEKIKSIVKKEQI